MTINKIGLLLLLLSTTFTASSQTQPARIISAGAGLTELFFALGAEENLIAVDLTSRHYATQANLPQVGYHRQLSSEGLMSLAPTLLIGTDEMGPETTLDMLKASQVEVVKVPTGNSLARLEQRIDMIATLTGKQNEAIKLKSEIEQSIQILESHPLIHPPKILFLMLHKDRSPNVGGSHTSINEIIHLSGAQNPAAEIVESYKPISFEGIIKMNPDYILVSQRAWDSFGGKQNILTKNPLLMATPAGSAGRIIPVPSSALIGFGLESIKLAEQLKKSFLAEKG